MDITVVLSTAVNEKLATASARSQSASVRFKGLKSEMPRSRCRARSHPLQSEEGAQAHLQRCTRGVLEESGAANAGEQHEVRDRCDDDLNWQKHADRTACAAMRACIVGTDHGVPPRPSRAASARTIVVPGCAGQSHATGDD